MSVIWATSSDGSVVHELVQLNKYLNWTNWTSSQLKIAPAKWPECKMLILKKMRKSCPMEEKKNIQNLSWGIERVDLHAPDHIFISEKHERSVATVRNKKNNSFRSLCRYEKHVSNAFLKFSKIIERWSWHSREHLVWWMCQCVQPHLLLYATNACVPNANRNSSVPALKHACLVKPQLVCHTFWAGELVFTILYAHCTWLQQKLTNGPFIAM